MIQLYNKNEFRVLDGEERIITSFTGLSPKIHHWETLHVIVIDLLSHHTCPGYKPVKDKLKYKLDADNPIAAARNFLRCINQDSYRANKCKGIMRMKPKSRQTPLSKCTNCEKMKRGLQEAVYHIAKRRKEGAQERDMVPQQHEVIERFRLRAKAAVAKAKYWKTKYLTYAMVDLETSKTLLHVVKVAEDVLSPDNKLNPACQKLLEGHAKEEVQQCLLDMRKEKEKEVQIKVKQENNEERKQTTTPERFRFLQEKMEEEKKRKSRIKWPAMILNVAIAIYRHSRSAYTLLQSMGILVLPSTRLMRAYRGAGLGIPGVDLSNMQQQVTQMMQFAEDIDHPLKGMLCCTDSSFR